MSEVILNARTRFELSNPDLIMDQLLDHFNEHGQVERDGRKARVAFSFAEASAEWDASTVSFDVRSPDEDGLVSMKLSIIEHIFHFLEGTVKRPLVVWEGDGKDGGPLPNFRAMTVVSASNVTPYMKRLKLKGDDIDHFTRSGLHVRLVIPPRGTEVPEWPMLGSDGRIVWPVGDAKPASRVYTIRKHDLEQGTLDVDMVVHGEAGEAPGSTLAIDAKEGDIIGMMGPGGGNAVHAKWLLLAGDETALPAIGRILEELPETTKAVVRVEVADKSEEQALSSRADVDLQWLHRDGAEAGTTGLLREAVKAIDIPAADEDIFVWVGCEFEDFRAIRSYVRKERQIPREKHLIVAYWRRGHDGDNARGRDED